MGFWDDVKKDLQKGLKESKKGLAVGYKAVKEKAEELTEEGKKMLKVLSLKTQAHKEVSELGGRVYDLSGTKKNPLLDAKVKSSVSKIKKLEALIAKIEGKAKTAVKPKAKAKAKK